MTSKQAPLRHLVVVLGDQLAGRSAALDGFDPARDRIWMAEVPDESRRAPSHRARTLMFLAAMRHYATRQREQGRHLYYRSLGTHPYRTLHEALAADLADLDPQRVIALEPGEWRLRGDLEQACARAGIDLQWREDRHFLCRHEDFERWAKGRRQWVMETFYRHQRRRSGILMDGDQPLGGRWNFDRDNRHALDSTALAELPRPLAFTPDRLTRETGRDILRHLPDLPGNLQAFDWPLTPEAARRALDDFISHRLPLFGRYQDAMWEGEPWLFHARLSAAMNLKLLDPQRVIDAALQALQDGHAPLNAVEGFVRQILGWREYVRGVYWQRMPDYLETNALDAQRPLPPLYWSGETRMRCLADVVGQILRLGYAHHIQRLMVTGLFALLFGARPQAVHQWYLGMFVDAVEWVEVPNTLGMSQYADGGLLASKPYAASGRYIQRMSNYCRHCPFDPKQRSGPNACPFTVLYWDFLLRHQARFHNHPRAGMQWRNLERLDNTERQQIRRRAARLRRAVADGAL